MASSSSSGSRGQRLAKQQELLVRDRYKSHRSHKSSTSQSQKVKVRDLKNGALSIEARLFKSRSNFKLQFESSQR